MTSGALNGHDFRDYLDMLRKKLIKKETTLGFFFFGTY